MSDFIETTDVFVKNINQSLIEREQLTDCLEILHDKVVGYQETHSCCDKSFRQIISLTETLVRSSGNRLAIDEDLVMVFESKHLRDAKEKLKDLDDIF